MPGFDQRPREQSTYETISPADVYTAALMIQGVEGHLQEHFLDVVKGNQLGSPDRIAIHDPVGVIAEEARAMAEDEIPIERTLVHGTIKKLEGLHGFRDVRLAVSERTPRLDENLPIAAAAIRNTFPWLRVNTHVIEDARNVQPAEVMIYTCSDWRLYLAFMKMIRGQRATLETRATQRPTFRVITTYKSNTHLGALPGQLKYQDFSRSIIV
jgi:hypothetical protein